MKTFRISQDKDYKIEGLNKDGRLLAVSTDNGFRSLNDMLARLRTKAGKGVAEMTVLCYNDDTFARYKVALSVCGEYRFKRV